MNELETLLEQQEKLKENADKMFNDNVILLPTHLQEEARQLMKDVKSGKIKGSDIPNIISKWALKS